MNRVLLLDSSVWVASVNADDPFELASRKLIAAERPRFGALDLTLYEVANVVARKRRRPTDAMSLCRSVERQCEHTIVRIETELIATAIEVVAEYGLTAYDAAYVAVARRNRWQLVSTDIKDLVSKGLAVTPDGAV